MRISWSKIGFFTIDLILGAYLLLAFTAFNKTDEVQKICSGVDIQIEDYTQNGFISKAEIETRLEKARLHPRMQPMSRINTRKIEENLQRMPFVRTAECYKTQDGLVRINITQRMPILRIKAINGEDYYLDDNNQRMQNAHYTSDLIVATGHIRQQFAQRYLAPLIKTISADTFWEQEIEQINVLPDKGIELIPRVGDHIVFLGHLPESKDAKEQQRLIAEFTTRQLDRLKKFYIYGLSQAGWNKYSRINLEFDNQIICKRREQ